LASPAEDTPVAATLRFALVMDRPHRRMTRVGLSAFGFG